MVLAIRTFPSSRHRNGCVLLRWHEAVERESVSEVRREGWISSCSNGHTLLGCVNMVVIKIVEGGRGGHGCAKQVLRAKEEDAEMCVTQSCAFMRTLKVYLRVHLPPHDVLRSFLLHPHLIRPNRHRLHLLLLSDGQRPGERRAPTLALMLAGVDIQW